MYDFQTVDDKFTLGDYTYKIIHAQSNDDYLATLTSYSGAGGNIVVPPTISWGEQTQVPITKLGPAAFSRTKGDIYSIDMSGLEEMEAVSTNRTASEARHLCYYQQ